MTRRILALTALPALLAANLVIGCLSEGGLAPTQGGGPTDAGPGNQPPIATPDAAVDIDPDAAVEDPTTNDAIKDSTQFLTYMDDLTTHPGCTKANMQGRVDFFTGPISYIPADLPNFNCAAREFNIPANEDQTRPVIILVHGNSASPRDWENNADDDVAPGAPGYVKMIAPTLADDGWHVFEADFRVDQVPNDATNPAKNVDHGWTVPIMEQLIRSVHARYPTRKINLAGFSLGTTVIRDALRRMHHKGEFPFAYIRALHLVSGANHGVNSYGRLCPNGVPAINGMISWVACQMGNRDAYTPTAFSTVLNGTDGAYETPCADGIHAYGQTNVCGANRVLYTTTVFEDPADGPLQDEFVSETSAALRGADNRTVSQLDQSGYFGALFTHHNGSIRSAEGVSIAKQALER